MKTVKEKQITPAQIKALHACFKAEGMDEENRHNFINHFTFGRVSSTKELTLAEGTHMLRHLKGEDEKKNKAEAAKLVKAIYYLSLNISFLNKKFADDDSAEAFEMNKAKINGFAATKSKAKKAVKQMTLQELRDFKKQLESIARKENENID
ncbi:MAG: hypothetical protein ACRCUJ_01630 [Phocaeicola sp.]